MQIRESRLFKTWRNHNQHVSDPIEVQAHINLFWLQSNLVFNKDSETRKISPLLNMLELCVCVWSSLPLGCQLRRSRQLLGFLYIFNINVILHGFYCRFWNHQYCYWYSDLSNTTWDTILTIDIIRTVT